MGFDHDPQHFQNWHAIAAVRKNAHQVLPESTRLDHLMNQCRLTSLAERFDKRKKKSKCLQVVATFWTKSGCRHWLLALSVFLYTLAGGWSLKLVNITPNSKETLLSLILWTYFCWIAIYCILIGL